MQKYLGLDVGTVRIGVAAADDSVKIAFPVTTIANETDSFTEIQKLIDRHSASAVVIGLPRNSKGEETEQSKFSRDFAAKLTSKGIIVKFQDESLTSVTAEQRLQERKKPYTKADIDAEAATIILQDYIDQL